MNGCNLCGVIGGVMGERLFVGCLLSCCCKVFIGCNVCCIIYKVIDMIIISKVV